MSDFNRDPYNPTPMGSGGYDQYGNSRFPPDGDTGRGPYILLAILVAIGVIGGLLYFNHKPLDQNHQQAQAPITGTTTTPPSSPAAPGAPPLGGATMPRPGTGDTANPTPAPAGGTH